VVVITRLASEAPQIAVKAGVTRHPPLSLFCWERGQPCSRPRWPPEVDTPRSRSAFRRARGGARAHKGSARPASAVRPAPPPAWPRPGGGGPGAVPDAPHCLRGAAALQRPSRAQPGLAPQPRPASPLPFVEGDQAAEVGCAVAAPGPGSEAPGGEEAARPGPGHRARQRRAEGLRRPRPARPSRALDRSVPGRGKGSRGRGCAPRRKTGAALGAARGRPTRLPGSASRDARPLGAGEVPAVPRPGSRRPRRAARFRASGSPHAPAPRARPSGGPRV
jgi:hypothetical protein